MKKLTSIICLLFIVSLFGCAAEIDPITGKRKNYENNPETKAKEYRDKGGGILNTFKSNNSNSFEFATSNILWRATLNSLDFLPLQTVDYSGGIILTDWYSSDNSNESIKIRVKFNSSTLAVSSIEVISHKKVCNNLNSCKIVKLDNSFNNQIKNKIIEQAKVLKIQEEKKKIN